MGRSLQKSTEVMYWCNKRYSAVQMQGVKCSINVGQGSVFEIFVNTTLTKIVLLLHIYSFLTLR